MARRFAENAGFGKRIEFWIIAEMIRHGLDVYVPLVDDKGIDAVVRKHNGGYVEVQVKARSENAKPGTEALFTVRSHELRENYWFVFYSEPLNIKWIMTSKEFLSESRQTSSGKWKGLRWIDLNAKRKAKHFQRYIATDYRKIDEQRLQTPVDEMVTEVHPIS